MKIKDGVICKGTRSETLIAISVLAGIFGKLGKEFIITSLLDGKHMRNSLHYVGLAVDVRTRDLDDAQKQALLTEAKEELEPFYDVLLEEDHLHVEFDPNP